MREVDEIGHLGCDQGDGRERTTADLGLAKASSADCGPLLVEGSDDAGKPWVAHMERVGGIGWTRAFTADFDANGRRDLLFVQFFLGNGRCLDGVTVTALLFDDVGRPVPWRVETYGLDGYDGDLLTLLDEDGDGKAELATSGCEYSQGPRIGEDRRLTGVYEAEGTHWRPLKPPSIEPYVRRFQRKMPPFAEWAPPAESWLDPHAGWDGPEDHLDGLIHGAKGTVHPHYRSGATGKTSDSVVIDSPAGREIFLLETETAYRRILASDALVSPLGNGEGPAILWARLDSEGTPATLTARMDYRDVETTVVRSAPAPGLLDSLTAWVTGEPTKPWAPTVTLPRGYFSRNGRCFRLGDGAANEMNVELLDDCTEFQVMRPEALQGKRVRIINTQWDVSAWVLDPGSRGFHSESGLGSRKYSPEPVEIEPLRGRVGELLAVIPYADGFISQWRMGAQTWLTIHDDSGAPISPAIDPEREGELFLRDTYSGKLCFLRRDGETPVDLTCARAEFTLARSR